MPKHDKEPKSWEKQLKWMHGHRKSYRKSRFVKARKRYWISRVMSWTHPDYMTKEEIELAFYRFIEMRAK